jgi:mannose/fructose/N-acetylgalactosamine-specific phosphotransferase system component IIC
VEFLWVALVGGLVGLDTSAVFQIMLCQPLVGGALAGWAMGDPWGGAFIGLLFQGLYLAELPIGGRFFTDGHQAAVQGAGAYALLNTQLYFDPGVSLLLSFFWAVPISIFYGYFIVWTRRRHEQYLPLVDRLVEEDRRRELNLLYVAAILENFLAYAILTAVLLGVAALVLPPIAKVFSAGVVMERWGLVLRGGMLGAGCGALYYLLAGSRKTLKFYLWLASAATAGGIWAAGY